MRLYRTLLLTACALAAATPALGMRPADRTQLALNDRPRDQDRAFRATQEGKAMPLPMIEQRVLPHMRGADYLGPELRGRNVRMKFMDNGKVIWVDVDPRTGRILGKSSD